MIKFELLNKIINKSDSNKKNKIKEIKNEA